MSKKTVIECHNCDGTQGEYLGVITDSTGSNHIHKCLTCKQHVKYDIKTNGVNYA